MATKKKTPTRKVKRVDPKKFTLTFEFDDADVRDGFITWFLDCGGDQDYWAAVEQWNRRESVKSAIFEGWPAGCPKHLKNITIQAPSSDEETDEEIDRELDDVD